jgi:hypothetical protein
MKMHPKSNSQAGQESFVLEMTNYKKNGVYVEIGAYHSWMDSNTLILETEFDWTGISLELNKERCDEFNLKRKNNCINANAINFNYKKFFKENNFPKTFDYLQLDIEPAFNTFRALIKFPLRKYKPFVITFEHDKYANGFNWIIQILAFLFLSTHNYKRIKANVTPLAKGLEKNSFEDWYVKKKIHKEHLR